MRLFKENAEDALTYADTVILKVAPTGSSVHVNAEGYNESKIKLKFESAKLIYASQDWPEIVDSSQKVKINNGNNRLILFNDENEIFLEIEHFGCKNI